jgi:hypothetical protein
VPFDAGELRAHIVLDQSRYDRGLDEAKAKGEKFDGKTWTSKLDVDTSLMQSKLGSMGKLVADHSAQLRSAGAGATLAVTAPILALDAIAISKASSLAEAQNKVSVVFDDSAGSVLAWGENAAEAIGQSERQALSAAGTFGNLFVSMDMGARESADMSMNLVNLASDLASFNDVSPDEALEALRSGLVGETEPMRRFGVNMSDATLKAQALAMGLEWQGETLPPLVKAQAAYALIMDQTATAQGDFARTADEVANSERTAKAMAEDMAASWGQELLPVAKEMLGVAKPMLDFFESLPGPVKTTAVALSGLFAVIGPSLWMIGAMADGIKTIKNVVEWMRPAKVAADTAAIAANTAAVEANTIARGLNAATPPVGSSGVVPSLVGTGGAAAGGLGALGTAGAIGVAGASAVLGGLLIYEGITYVQAPSSPSATTVTGGTAGVGRAGAASQEAAADEVRAQTVRYAAGVAELNDIIAEIKKLKPTAGNVGAVDRFAAELDAVADEYPELGDRVGETKAALLKGEEAFEAAAKQAAALAEQERQTYGSLEAWNEAMMKAMFGLGPMPTNEQLVYAAVSDQMANMAMGGPIPDATEASIFSAGQKGMRRFASGGSFITNGPEIALFGDNPGGRELVTATPLGSSGITSRSGDHFHLHFHSTWPISPQQADEVADVLEPVLVQRADRAMR